MIDLAEVLKALGQVITGSGLFPRIVWQNRDGLPAKPFLIVELLPGPIRDDTLSQTAPTWSGSLLCTVVMDLNRYDAEGRAMIGQLAALFPAGERHSIPGGAVMIAGHPRPLPGYRDGADYRLQLSIPLKSD